MASQKTKDRLMTPESAQSIHKIGAIILHEGKLLVLHKHTPDNRAECIIPGGRVEGGETHEQTLKRELMEELGVGVVDMKYFGSFDDIAVFEGIPIHMDVYTVSIEGVPKSKSEIKECVWIGPDYHDRGIQLGSVLERHVIPKLITGGSLR